MTSCEKRNDVIYIEEIKPTCIENGVEGYYYNKINGKTYKDLECRYEIEALKSIPALGHDISTEFYSDSVGHFHKCNRCLMILDYEKHMTTSSDYIRFSKCDICETTFENKTEIDFLDTLKYDYTIEDANKFRNIYENAMKIFEETNVSDEKLGFNFDFLNNALDELDKMEDYLNINSFAAELRFYLYNTSEWSDAYINMRNIYNEYCLDYNRLLLNVVKGEYRELYKENKEVSDEYIDNLITNLEGYSNERLDTINMRINELEYNLYYGNLSYKEYEKAFNELRDIRNEKANIFNFDNYYEYAYKKIYNRSYSTSMIKDLRNYLKDYFIDILRSITNRFMVVDQRMTLEQKSIADTINNSKFFESEYLRDIVADYFSLMIDEDNDIDFYNKINEAFKDGRVMTGTNRRAFTALLPELDNLKMMYFGNSGSYSLVSSFIHESGHFMFMRDDITDYDFLETHSQSNEEMFMAYLDTIFNDADQDIFDYVLFYHFMDNFNTIFSTLISDEIEEALYLNYYHDDNVDTKKFEDGITYSELEDLTFAICSKYGLNYKIYTGYSNSYYANRSCYEVSYAVSLIPCIALFCDAEMNSFSTAKDNFFKTYLYAFDEEFINSSTEITYLDILSYANYYSPFNENTYVFIKNYFSESMK